MGKAFHLMVAAGMAGLVAMGWYQGSRASRLRARAEDAGLASAEILVREMG